MSVLMLIGLALVLADATDLALGGLAVLGAIIAGLGLWVAGFFTAEWWIGDQAYNDRCDRIDQDLTRQERAS